ncbi:MAG: glycerate kinase [Bacteroidetes bacterium]|nr:glycerate kinase [Bacteroidota bacterium]
MPFHFLIAPNAFKNSLSAEAAAAAIARGLSDGGLSLTSESFPVGDGGDGTIGLIADRLGAARIEATVRDPLGRNVTTWFGLVDGHGAGQGTATGDTGITALIEMANASGLRLLETAELDPLHALSAGTGELVRTALDRGAHRIVIGMGGSATVDGGVGILQALGARFLDKHGTPLIGLPASLTELDSIDASGLDPRLAGCEIVVLCDVDNPLLGPSGAAAVYGPQKGATPAAAQLLDRCLQRLAEVIAKTTKRDMRTVIYGGTAGGAAAGLYGLLNATLVGGIDYFLDITGFDRSLAKADLVITGEGSIDEQTLRGKAPMGVATRAKKIGITVVGLAGKVPLQPGPGLSKYFDILLAIGNEPSDLPTALKNTAANLSRTSAGIGRLLALSRLKR